jgi:hypothetical protein
VRDGGLHQLGVPTEQTRSAQLARTPIATDEAAKRRAPRLVDLHVHLASLEARVAALAHGQRQQGSESTLTLEGVVSPFPPGLCLPLGSRDLPDERASGFGR